MQITTNHAESENLHTFQKFKMAEKWIIRNISARVQPIGMKFCVNMQIANANCAESENIPD